MVIRVGGGGGGGGGGGCRQQHLAGMGGHLGRAYELHTYLPMLAVPLKLRVWVRS